MFCSSARVCASQSTAAWPVSGVVQSFLSFGNTLSKITWLPVRIMAWTSFELAPVMRPMLSIAPVMCAISPAPAATIEAASAHRASMPLRVDSS